MPEEPTVSTTGPDAPKVDADAAKPPTETDWTAEARKWEQRAKDNMKRVQELEPKAQQFAALEEASKSDLTKALEDVQRWQTDAQQWRTAAVSARVEAIASGDFADPSDAVTAVDPSKYLDAGGQIDEAAIRADLAEVLQRKPHWRRAEPGAASPRVPAPNPAQGSGVNGRVATSPAAEFASILQAQMPTRA